MREHGFMFCDDIIGITIRAYHYIERGIHLAIPRGVEIKQWMDTHIHSNNGKDWNKKEITVDYNYVIIDDDTDMLLEHRCNFVNTNGEFPLNPHPFLPPLPFVSILDTLVASG